LSLTWRQQTQRNLFLSENALNSAATRNSKSKQFAFSVLLTLENINDSSKDSHQYEIAQLKVQIKQEIKGFRKCKL